MSENWLLEIEVKLMYYEQLCCIMHWFRLNQGRGRALDSFEIVQGSMRLYEHVVSKSLFFFLIFILFSSLTKELLEVPFPPLRKESNPLQSHSMVFDTNEQGCCHSGVVV